MADETTITTPPTAETPATPVNPVEARITDLSSKVKTASEERDAALARETAANKKAEFNEGFVDVVTEFSAAKEHKTEIEEKFKAGYTVKDATFAVLGAAGKLGAPKVDRQPIGGGSASTTITAPSGGKEISNMTQAERKEALQEAQRRGDLSLT